MEKEKLITLFLGKKQKLVTDARYKMKINIDSVSHDRTLSLFKYMSYWESNQLTCTYEMRSKGVISNDRVELIKYDMNCQVVKSRILMRLKK